MRFRRGARFEEFMHPIAGQGQSRIWTETVQNLDLHFVARDGQVSVETRALRREGGPARKSLGVV